MVKEIIEEILSAENQAANIKYNADITVRKIEDKNQVTIEKLRTDYLNEVIEKTKDLTESQTNTNDTEYKSCRPNSKKLESAKKHIIDCVLAMGDMK